MPEEAHGRYNGQLGLHPCQEDTLQPGQRALDNGREGQSDQHRRHPGAVLPDQYVVYEYLDQGRDGHAGHNEGQGRQRRERKRTPRVTETVTQSPNQIGLRSARTEPGRRRESEADAREALHELLHRYPSRAFAGIVDIDSVPFDPFENDEMVEFPEDHHGKRNVEQLLVLAAETPGNEAVFPCRIQHIGGIGAVPGDAAAYPQRFKGHPSSVIGENDAQTCGGALRGLHLQDRRRPETSAPIGPEVRMQLSVGIQ